MSQFEPNTRDRFIVETALQMLEKTSEIRHPKSSRADYYRQAEPDSEPIPKMRFQRDD